MIIKCSTSDGRSFKIAISTKQIDMMYTSPDMDSEIIDIATMWMAIGRKFLNEATKLREGKEDV